MKKFMTEFKDKDEEKAASEAEDDPEPDINEQTLEVLNNISTIAAVKAFLVAVQSRYFKIFFSCQFFE